MADPPRLLLCEGPEDKAFFERLIRTRSLPSFRISDTGGKILKAAGNTRFGFALKAKKLERGVKDILIVADNDEAPDKSFSNVCKQIRDAYDSDKVPDRPLEKVSNDPSIMVLMIPWEGELGCLETLCEEAAWTANGQIAGHVDLFAAMIGADNWGKQTRKSKMLLRTMLAATCERDPFVFLKTVFRETRNQYLIPLNHSCFARVADVLSQYRR